MLARLLLVELLVLLLSAAAASAQEKIPTIIWNDELPNCGGSNIDLAPGTVTCVVTVGDFTELTFQHKDLRVSMTHSWSRGSLRAVLTVKNSSNVAIPVNVKMWRLTGYKSLEDMFADREPVGTSKAKKPPPIVNRSGMLDTSTVGLPSNAPVTREVTRNQTTNATTGQILNPNSKIISPGPNGSVNSRSSVMRSVGARGASATKWTEIPARSLEIGEVRFSTDADAKYVAVSFHINRTMYIYRLARLSK